MDDTKEEADAGSFGMLVAIRSGTGLPTSMFVGLMEDVLLKVAERVVEEERHLMGHIKAFVTTPEGTLKLNIVDLDLGVETMNRLQGGTVRSGEMKFMAAIVGIKDKELEEIMEKSLDILRPSFDLEIKDHHHDEHDGHEDSC